MLNVAGTHEAIVVTGSGTSAMGELPLPTLQRFLVALETSISKIHSSH